MFQTLLSDLKCFIVEFAIQMFIPVSMIGDHVIFHLLVDMNFLDVSSKLAAR